MNRQVKQPHSPAKFKAWVKAVGHLMDQVDSWAKEQSWLVERKEKAITEEQTGSYSLPQLTIKTRSAVQLVVEPVALYVVGAEGRVDLLSFPTLHRFLLIRSDGRWVLKTDSGIEWPQPWGRETFLSVVDALVEAT